MIKLKIGSNTASFTSFDIAALVSIFFEAAFVGGLKAKDVKEINEQISSRILLAETNLISLMVIKF